MKILLINNSTKHLENLQKNLKQHEVEVVKYKPGANFNTEDKDLIILSGGGGEGREANDKYKKNGNLWYIDEMKLVKESNKPILGICMGFEVICKAYGSDVKKVGRLVSGFKKAITSPRGAKLVNQAELKQFESHYWCVEKLPTGFELLASSKTGIEMIAHKKRPILATQFHPEVDGGTLSLIDLINKATSLAKA